MRRIVFPVMLLLMPLLLVAQDNIEQLMKEGIELYQKGDYHGSMSKYDEVLKISPDHDIAIYEKSLSLIRLRNYDEATALLKKVLDISKDPKLRKMAFSNYGTALDLNGKPKESLAIYNKGIKEFPDDNMIHFNKGITLLQLKEYDDATLSFQKSVKLRPMHASSHNALARMVMDKSRIKGVLAVFSFLLVEPEGKRAEDNVKLLNQLIMKGVSQKDEKNVTINLDMGDLDKKKDKEDDFSSAELMLSLLAAHVPDSLKSRPAADKLAHRMSSLISMIEETNKKDKGFFRNFYVPFFVEIKNNGMTQTACYVALTSSGDETVFQWQNANKPKVEEFLAWLEGYKWGKE